MNKTIILTKQIESAGSRADKNIKEDILTYRTVIQYVSATVNIMKVFDLWHCLNCIVEVGP